MRNMQNGEIWRGHFENLKKKQDQMYQKMIAMENAFNKYQNTLDFPITEAELTEKLQGLQPKKASGPDGTLNEMIKNTSHSFRLAILKRFKLVLSVGHFPDLWSKGLITPLFKSGGRYDPNNHLREH